MITAQRVVETVGYHPDIDAIRVNVDAGDQSDQDRTRLRVWQLGPGARDLGGPFDQPFAVAMVPDMGLDRIEYLPGIGQETAKPVDGDPLDVGRWNAATA
jgi:hypothetical protein